MEQLHRIHDVGGGTRSGVDRSNRLLVAGSAVPRLTRTPRPVNSLIKVLQPVPQGRGDHSDHPASCILQLVKTGKVALLQELFLHRPL